VRLAEEGVDVIVTDVDVGGGEETVDRLADGVDSRFLELDVREYGAVETVLSETVEEFGGVDVLFNNAGVGEAQSFGETTPEHRDRLIDVNLKGVWNGCHAALSVMEEGGSIINTASMAAWLPAGITSYAMTKAAVLHFTRSVAQEFGREGIRVNAICPGTVETSMFERWYTDEQQEHMKKRNAVGRLGQPEEIAACVTFLASDDASFITGRGFKVDGGYL
jgi:NAD(P)-dependent dehydrogenase (short-subunit alcohol dehydrogenase family)